MRKNLSEGSCFFDKNFLAVRNLVLIFLLNKTVRLTSTILKPPISIGGLGKTHDSHLSSIQNMTSTRHKWDVLQR